MKKSSIHIACLDGIVFCKVAGLGRMHNSGPLRNFAEQAFLDGYSQFVIDLAECTGMDSTFMGTLLGIHLLKKGHGVSPKLVLINVSQENFKLLDGLGLTQVLKVNQGAVETPVLDMVELKEEKVSQKEWLQNIYEAHKNLIEIHPENHKKYGKFVESLFGELA